MHCLTWVNCIFETGNTTRQRPVFKTSQLVTTGPSAWQSSLRLAEIAGYQSQPDALEKHLRDAIQRGFPPAQLTKHPSWAALYRVPLLQDKIYKLLLVYGDVRYLRDFETQKNPG